MTTFANDDDITSASKNPGTTVLAIVTETFEKDSKGNENVVPVVESTKDNANIL